MRFLRRCRVGIPKTRRILCAFLLFMGLYFLYILVLRVRSFIISTPTNETSWLDNLKRDKVNVHNVLQNSSELNEEVESSEPEPPRNSSIDGALNVHTWVFACELGLQKFLQNPLFPVSPNAETFVGKLEIKWVEQKSEKVKTFGRRIFGFILAPSTGRYKFSMVINSDAELWLSRDTYWENVQLVSQKNSSKFYSSEVHLKEHQFYFIEILFIQISQNSFHLTWKMPHSEDFEEISKEYLYSFMGKSNQKFIREAPLTKATQRYITSHPKLSILSSTGKFLSGVKYAEWNDVKSALPLCRYHPGYVGKKVLHQYHAVEKFVNPSYVYPEVIHAKIKDAKWNPWFPLSKEEALGIVEKYLKYLEGAYKLIEILNVEKKPDWHQANDVFYKGTLKHGDRFFLELLLSDITDDKQVIVSEYVYQYKNKTMCYPEGMQWNKSAPVYLLISVRKQPAWVWHFIKNVEQIYKITADENLHVIIYDYNSTSIDIESEFKQSSFKNYKILRNPNSKYSRTYSLNRAATAVKDPNAIIFTLDLHLEIPPLFPYNVRKVSWYHPIIC